MAGKKSEENSLDEITSLLDTIDTLVSASGHTEDITARTASISIIKTDELKDDGFIDAQLEEIAKGMAENLPVEVYAKKCYNWMQMSEIRQGLQNHLDTGIYESPLYSASQMREIRFGLLDHLDVSSYASLVLSASDMRKIRRALFASVYKHSPSGFGKTIKDDETGIIIRINDDCTRAFVKIPEHVPEDFTEENLREVLKSHEIVHGIIDENLPIALQNRSADQEICIAKGKRPQQGKSGWYEIFFVNNIEKWHTIPPDGEIDYTDVNTVDLVTCGTVLAKYHPAEKHTEGITVTGITIEGTPGIDLPALSGMGFRRDLEQNTYIATEEGYVSYNDTTSSLNVCKVYRFNGDVPYYQSLAYDGTVHIAGSVRGSATVRAKGDIIVDGFVENATLYSEQNIVIKGGANGGSQGRIEAGGSIRGGFFENIDLIAKGLIESNYYLNSNIRTDDRLVARGKKARIIGGKISAAISVDVVIVGNYLGGKTVFNVGDIHSYEKQISLISVDKKKVTEELDQLTMGKQKLILLLGEEQAAGNTLYEKTCAAIHTKELQLNDIDREIERLRQVINRAQKAYIRVHGQLQSDVTIIVNNIKKETPTPTNRSVLLTRKECMKKR